MDGYNSTKSISTTWSIPKGKWKLTAGSSWMKATDTRYKVVAPCNNTNATTVTANYTRATWSDKVQQ
jgi:hemolysin activation/secretion protein